MDDSKSTTVALLGCTVLILLIVPCAIQNGWILSVCWRWFMVPLGVPPIGVAHAIGLFSIVGLFKGGTHKGGEIEWPHVIGAMLIAPWLTLGIAAVVHSFM